MIGAIVLVGVMYLGAIAWIKAYDPKMPWSEWFGFSLALGLLMAASFTATLYAEHSSKE